MVFDTNYSSGAGKMSEQFPEGFLWGTSTSAHQVEGSNFNSDHWLLEHVEPTVFVEPSGDACDQYHRYESDIAMLADLGFNTYRFSVEWARIEPEPGFFSRTELDHYRRVLEACHKYSISPVVTLHHFTSPRWLAGCGGWESDATPALFGQYALKVAESLGSDIDYVCTINELNIVALLKAFGGAFFDVDKVRDMLSAGAKASGLDSYPTFFYGDADRIEPIVIEAHNKAVQAVHSVRSDLPVGMTVAIQDFQAVEGGEDLMLEQRYKAQDVYLEAAKGGDFIGVQTYTRMLFGPDGLLPPSSDSELTQMGYEFCPEALEATIRHAVKITGSPALVTENGIGTDDDARRIVFLRKALEGVLRCLEDGIDVRGYCQWSLLDNFEWMLGYRPTFGIVSVDRNTQERIPKPSATWLGRMAKENALVSD